VNLKLLFKKKSLKNAIHRMGENIGNHVSDKGLISSTYKEFL
jgi:hypothetical protein